VPVGYGIKSAGIDRTYFHRSPQSAATQKQPAMDMKTHYMG
jgi:hypothetical protein